MPASEPLPHFIDDLLAYLHETHPTFATLDGVHAHDDLLEDLSRHAIEDEARALAGYLRRLGEIDAGALPRMERLEHRMLVSSLKGRMFELEDIRTWERNPQFYADILASSIAGQALFTYAPAPERARRVLSKLRQTPRLIQAARDNIKEPPGIFVKVGLETLRGVLTFIENDLPGRFRPSMTCICSAILRTVRPRRRMHSVLIFRSSRQKWRRALADHFASAGTGSKRNSDSTKGCRCLLIACSRLPLVN